MSLGEAGWRQRAVTLGAGFAGCAATNGRAALDARLPRGLKLSGAIAWWSCLLEQFLFLGGLRNSPAKPIDWAWSCVTCQQRARLIVEAPRISSAPSRS
jgi:hypothetical protein